MEEHGWAPVDAGALPTAEQPLREAEFEALFATALRGVQARARDLIARESACCTFFDFRRTAHRDRLELDVRVPEARTEVLERLARRGGGAEVPEAVA